MHAYLPHTEVTLPHRGRCQLLSLQCDGIFPTNIFNTPILFGCVLLDPFNNSISLVVELDRFIPSRIYKFSHPSMAWCHRAYSLTYHFLRLVYTEMYPIQFQYHWSFLTHTQTIYSYL